MGKYKLKYMFIIFTFISLTLSSNLYSTPLLDSLNVKFIGNWPFGSSSSITYDSTRNLAFCSAGGGAYIIDITDPQNPVKISDLRTRGEIKEMFFDPSLSRIYLAVARAGLEIWDLTDPSNPVRTGVLRDYLTYPRDIFVDDTLAYLVDGYHLSIVNVKDQYNPFIVSSYSFTSFAYGIYVAGNYAYVANWSGGLRIIDIQDPSNPQEVGHYTTPTAQDVCVNGNYAYILDTSLGLYIINIQDPSNPYEVSQLSVPFPYSLYKISFKGSFVYLSHGEYGLRIIDVSDPYNPLEVGVYNSPGTVVDAEIYDHYAYIADWRDGLRVVDIQDPSNPLELSQYDVPGFFVDVEVSGNYAFAVDIDDHTLYILDVQNPQQPYKVGKYTVQGAIYAYEVNVSGNYAYLACYNHGLEIIDVQDPSNPQPVGSFNISAYRVFLYGNYVYLCSGTGGINIIDVQDPSNPQLIGNYQTPGYASSVFVSGNLAYVTDQDSGLIILDVQDPSNPVRVGLYTLPPTSYAMNLYVKNNIAYVSHINGIFIIDVQDPSNPVQVGFYNGGGRSDIFASDIYLYIFGNRLEVIDVSDPSNPYLAGYYNTPVSTGRGYVRNNLIYVSDNNCGIQIYSNLLVKVKEQNLRPILIYGSGKGVLFTKDRFIKIGLNKNKIYDILGRKKLSFSNGNIYFYNVKDKKVKIIVF